MPRGTPGSQSATRKRKKDLVAITLERNSARLGLDFLDLVAGIISLITKVTQAIKAFKDFAPKVGWYMDLEFKVLEGKIELAWGWRECNDCEVYYYLGLAAEVVLLEVVLEFGFGVKVARVLGQVCVQFKGSVSLSGGVETTAPDADAVTLATLKPVFEAGGYVRVNAGDLIEIEGGIQSGITIEAKVEAKVKAGMQVNGDVRWDGLSVTVRAKTFFGFKKSTKMQVVEPEKLSEFQFPEGEDTMPPELSKHEISIMAEDALNAGFWEIRFFEQQMQSEAHFLSGPTWELKDVRIENPEIADLIAERLWQEKENLLLDAKTIDGLLQGLRKKCEILADKNWARDWLYKKDLEIYLGSAEFAEILQDAGDSGKEYRKRLAA